jgi:lysophospholipase L1-like esterase
MDFVRPQRHLPLLILWLCGALSLHAAKQVFVIGDSLTKEYEIEFPILFPNNPQSWDSRNWVELLHEQRNADFDLGSFATFLDWRITGHTHNWAYPGATTKELRDRLESTAFFDQIWQDEFDDQIKNDVERVVVFAGGNDVDDYYDDIYNGASAAQFTNKTRDNLKWIVDYIKGRKGTIPLVLVAVPHVGCAPDIQLNNPTHPTKTARVTTALDSLNAQLASYAATKGIGFASGVYDLTKDLINKPFSIGGTEFYRQADANAGVRFVFSGDGFHPNTCAHARISQIVVNAFREKYPTLNIPVVSDADLLNWLGVPLDTGLKEWLASFGVPASQQTTAGDYDRDGVPNLMEFLLDGMNPNAGDVSMLPKPVITTVSNQKVLRYSWKPSIQGLQYAPLVLMQSTNLNTWSAVPIANIVLNGDGSYTATLPATGSLFLQLSATK